MEYILGFSLGRNSAVMAHTHTTNICQSLRSYLLTNESIERRLAGRKGEEDVQQINMFY